ncbi:MAG: hypothetical protein HZB26_16155 [Candidatus Hydrogenedentes bacterium]|nr:hypothetical protein [Candidatus Hydrogenedentota bacterium]
MTSLRNAIFKGAARLFVPGLAEQMRREGTLDLHEANPAKNDELEHITVEDRGSDVTIFAFSGLAVLFAGMPTYEFRSLLLDGDHNYNLVFFRDLRRMGYRIAPDGTRTGRHYYENLIRELQNDLGSTYHVALGASSGGAAAFYYGSRCDMDQIIAFSPAFPHSCYTSLRSQLRTYFDVVKLFTDPSAYFELIMVTLGAAFGMSRIARAVPGEDILMGPMRAFLAASPRPRASIFYGSRCRPDSVQASQFTGIPGVKLIPVDSGRHNCAADLKKRGILASSILGEITEGLAAAGKA